MMTVNQVIALLLTAQPVDGVDPELVKEARDRLALAADVDRRHELGKAIQRLEGLFTQALEEDAKTALAVQKELNRLMCLYEVTEPVKAADRGTESQQELARIADHLLPLNLAPAEYPLSGHARIAADLLRQHGLPNTEAAT